MMNNSVFGKTMENIRNHKDMELVTNEQKCQKYVIKPNFKDGHPFPKDLFAVEMGNRDYDEQASVPWAGNIRPE